MKSYEHITQIEKRSGLSRKEFIREYASKALPVVITDKPDWVSFSKFTPEFFKANYGHMKKKVNGKEYTLTEIIDLCMASTPENKSPYPNIFDMNVYFPELIADIKPEFVYGKLNRLRSKLLPGFFFKRVGNTYELFFGGKGNNFPNVHVDELKVHTQMTQIIGDKEFFMFSPDQNAYMYPDPENPRKSSVNNIHAPDYDKYPLFRKARVLSVIVKPGETVFIPSGWWHTTYIHNFNLSFSTDCVNANNWSGFMDGVYKSIQSIHPKVAWVTKVYKVFGGMVFNIREFFIKID